MTPAPTRNTDRQPSPADLAAHPAELAARLRLAVARLQRRLRQQAAGGLTLTQSSLLATISREGPLTFGELAAAERLGPPTVTKLVAKLEEAGLVTRTEDPTDRRVRHVSITRSGQDELERMRARRAAWLAVHLEELTAAERRRLADALEVLERLADAPDTEPDTGVGDEGARP